MSKIVLRNFKGTQPALSNRLLQDNYAQTSQNAKLGSGELRPFRHIVRVHTPAKAGDLQTIYRWAAVPGEDASGVITNVANTTPVQITSAGHGLTNGQDAYIYNTGVAGIDNTLYTITRISDDVFSLNGTSASGSATPGAAYWTKRNGYWFHFNELVDIVSGPIPSDTTDRTYFTYDPSEGIQPKVTYSPIAQTGGGSEYPINSYNLGVPIPAAAPTATPGTGGGCDAADQVSRSYVYTYVSEIGEEGPPSAPSSVIDVCPGQEVDLSSMSVAPGGAYNIQTKRIYRTLGTTGRYYFVDEIPVANTTYNDTVADTSLVDEIESTTWIEPPSDMHSLKMMANGIGVGLSGKNVCISEPYVLSAWPLEYRQQTDENGLGIGVFGSSAVIPTAGRTYVLSGIDPAAMSLDKLESEQSCVSKRSIATLEGFGVVFASPDGLVAVGHNEPTLITDGWLTRDDWQAYNPETIIGFPWEGKYIGFYTESDGDQGCFIFDPKGGGIITVDLGANKTVTGGYYDIYDDALYLLVDTGSDYYIERFDANSLSNMTYTWKSKQFAPDRPMNFGWAKVVADGYTNMVIIITANGNDIYNELVTSGNPFRLPSNFDDGGSPFHGMADNFEITIVSSHQIKEIWLCESIEDFRTP